MTFSGVQKDIPYLCRPDDNLQIRARKEQDLKELMEQIRNPHV
jgi:hypothetical protein